jgi:hypothetical protein
MEEIDWKGQTRGASEIGSDAARNVKSDSSGRLAFLDFFPGQFVADLPLTSNR